MRCRGDLQSLGVSGDSPPAELVGPLRGVRVLDLTSVVLGTLATQILGDFGADVIKVESPVGDSIRPAGAARHRSMGSVHLAVNRSKRSLCVDLRSDEGREIIYRLIGDSDVVVHNMRVAAMSRLGLDYESVRARQPNVVYVAATGFDESGPEAGRPAYDDVIQAATGLAALESRGRLSPEFIPTLVADKTAGLAVVNALLAALFHRERTGEGQYVEVPMFETVTAFVMVEHLGGLTFVNHHRLAGYQRVLAGRRPFATSDGAIAIIPYSATQWRSLMTVAGRADLVEDIEPSTLLPGPDRVSSLHRELTAISAQRTTAQWLEVCREADVAASALVDLDHVFDSEQLRAVGLLEEREHPSEGAIRMVRPPVTFAQTPLEVVRLAPNLGEHSSEILREVGYNEGDIEALEAAGVIRQFRPDERSESPL